MRIRLFLPFLFIVSTMAAAQEPAAVPSSVASSKNADPAVPSAPVANEVSVAAIKHLAADAQGVPPMFSADILLKEESSLPKSAGELRTVLLETAWRAAGSAGEPYPTVRSAEYHSEGTVSDRSYVSGLDRLSLQSRVVLRMAPVDSARALQLFQTISVVDLPRQPGCEAHRIADPSIYYQAAEALIGQQRTPAEKMLLLTKLMRNATGEMSVSPLLRVVVRAGKLPLEQQTAEAQALSRMLDGIRGDDTAFTKSSAAVDADMPLALQVRAGNAKAAQWLKDSFRAYFQAHYAGMRCQTSLDSEAFAQETQNMDQEAKTLGLTEKDHVAAGILQTSTAAAESGDKTADRQGEELTSDAWSLVQSVLNGSSPAQISDQQRDEMAKFLLKVTDSEQQDDADFNLYKNRCVALHKLNSMLPEAPKATTSAKPS